MRLYRKKKSSKFYTAEQLKQIKYLEHMTKSKICIHTEQDIKKDT